MRLKMEVLNIAALWAYFVPCLVLCYKFGEAVRGLGGKVKEV
jgi:hypothetical protein